MKCLWCVPWRACSLTSDILVYRITKYPKVLYSKNTLSKLYYTKLNYTQKTHYLGPGWPSVQSSVRYNLESFCRRSLKALSFTLGARSSTHKSLIKASRKDAESGLPRPTKPSFQPLLVPAQLLGGAVVSESELLIYQMGTVTTGRGTVLRIRLYNTFRALRPATPLRSIQVDVLPVSSEVKGFSLWPGVFSTTAQWGAC